MNLHFHSDQCENQVFPGLFMQYVGGQYDNVSCLPQHHFKITDFYLNVFLTLVRQFKKATHSSIVDKNVRAKKTVIQI